MRAFVIVLLLATSGASAQRDTQVERFAPVPRRGGATLTMGHTF